MTETFKPRHTASVESLIFIKKRGNKELLEKKRKLAIPEGPENPNIFLEVLVICATVMLWATSVVMVIFGCYLLYHTYGITLLTEAYDFLISMILQVLASITLMAASILTSTCHNLNNVRVPRLAKWAIGFLAISILILIIEIVVSLYHRWVSDDFLETRLKQKLLHLFEHSYHLKEWNNMHKTLSCCGVNSKEDWTKNYNKTPESCCSKFKESKCISWFEEGCLTAYLRMKRHMLSFLTGSACISLTNTIIILPVLIKLLLVSIKLAAENLRTILTSTRQLSGPSPMHQTESNLTMQSNITSASDLGISEKKEKPDKKHVKFAKSVVKIFDK